MSKLLLKRIAFRLLLAISSEWKRPKVYERFLKVNIGDQCRFTGLINFGSEPELVNIGNHVTIANGVNFHTHDGGVWVFRKEYPKLNRYSAIFIHDNVFIGANSTLLPGVVIESNVVVGANSVVTKSLRKNGVYAGNPAKLIRTLDEYKRSSLENGVHQSFDKNLIPLCKGTLKRFSEAEDA